MKKVCISCGEEKELNRFDKRKKSKDGYRNQCRTCVYIKRKKRFESLPEEEKNKRIEKKRLARKKYVQKNKNNPEFKIGCLGKIMVYITVNSIMDGI
jgi:hypothetical protein